MAARSGTLLNLSEVGRDAGVEQPTAKRWHGVLQAGFVTFELLPHYRNFSKRLIKSPKIYFVDVGVARYLSGLRDLEHFRLSQAFGPLFETLVVSDIRKTLAHRGVEADLAFFRSSDGIEVDLLLTLGRHTHAFEIKGTATPGPGDLKGLRKWMEMSGTKTAHVLCLVDRPMPVEPGITAVPWWDHAKIWVD
jgi:predicted AAA+ superfamily ATPase